MSHNGTLSGTAIAEDVTRVTKAARVTKAIKRIRKSHGSKLLTVWHGLKTDADDVEMLKKQGDHILDVLLSKAKFYFKVLKDVEAVSPLIVNKGLWPNAKLIANKLKLWIFDEDGDHGTDVSGTNRALGKIPIQRFYNCIIAVWQLAEKRLARQLTVGGKHVTSGSGHLDLAPEDKVLNLIIDIGSRHMKELDEIACAKQAKDKKARLAAQHNAFAEGIMEQPKNMTSTADYQTPVQGGTTIRGRGRSRNRKRSRDDAGHTAFSSSIQTILEDSQAEYLKHCQQIFKLRAERVASKKKQREAREKEKIALATQREAQREAREKEKIALATQKLEVELRMLKSKEAVEIRRNEIELLKMETYKLETQFTAAVAALKIAKSRNSEKRAKQIEELIDRLQTQQMALLEELIDRLQMQQMALLLGDLK